MYSTMREVAFRTSDFDLFGQDISPSDYEFFKKHTGAFKRMLEDQSKEKKQEFVDAFKEFSLNHGCLKDCPTRNDSRLTYLEEAAQVYKESFVNGKFSTAKNIVMDAVTLAQNKHLLQNMGAKSYSKDPFFHKETRDVFRRLFGSPSLKDTFIKVICVLPLHIKFGGSICRYLRRWLDAEPVKSLPPQTSEPKKSSKQKSTASGGRSTSVKKEKEQAKLKEEKNLEEVARFQMYINEVFSQEAGPERMAQVKAAFESIGFPDFVKTETDSIPEEKPPTKTENETAKPLETPREEGLSLAEHLGVNNKNNKTKGKNDDKNGKSNPVVADEKVPEEVQRFSDAMKTHILSEDFFKPMSVSLERTPDGGVSIVTEPVVGEYRSPLDVVSDGSMEEIEKMFLLNKPHPNEQFDQLLGKQLSKENKAKLEQCKENAKQLRAQHEAEMMMRKTMQANSVNDNDWPVEKLKKRHACANCRKVEPEPKMFKKCQRCHGKRTRFYCSRTCQETDWVVCHREDHNSIEDVT